MGSASARYKSPFSCFLASFLVFRFIQLSEDDKIFPHLHSSAYRVILHCHLVLIYSKMDLH